MLNNRNSIAVVFDDHKLFADAFSALLDRAGFFYSVQVFTEEPELIRFFASIGNQWQLFFFVDYYLSDKRALSTISDARRLVNNIKVIIVSSVTDVLTIQNILTHNPDGFLTKLGGFSETLECIRSLEGNVQFISPAIANLIGDVSKLTNKHFTAREIEMLQYFNQGNSIAATAEKACLSRHTIVAHRRRMMEKTGYRSIGELLAFARKQGLI